MRNVSGSGIAMKGIVLESLVPEVRGLSFAEDAVLLWHAQVYKILVSNKR
jgi:hypothetical protein